MQTQIQYHRHLVAAPLFSVLVLLFVGYGVNTVSSQDFVVYSEERSDWHSFSLASGVQGMLFSGGDMDVSEDDVQLYAGSVLLSSDGLIQLRASRFTLIGYAGAFHVTLNGDSLAVAALTSPVLVSDGNHNTLVPAGLQWWSDSTPLPSLDAGYTLWMGARSLQKLPKRFLHTQLQNLTFLPEPADDVLPQPEASDPSAFHPPPFLFTVAQERHKERWGEKVLGALRYHIEQGDEDGAEQLLDDPMFTDVLSSPRGIEVLSVLLSRLPEDSSLDVPILSYLIQNEPYWLLTSVHPQFRARAWILTSIRAGEESHLVRLFVLPQSDVVADSLSEFTLRRWMQGVRSLEDPVSFLDQLIPVLGPFIERWEEEGYPERVRRLADALLSLTESHDEFSEATLRILDELKRIDKVEITSFSLEEPDEVDDEEDESAPESPEDFDPEKAESRAYQLLRDAGALFTVQTELRALSNDIVHVAGILFASEQGDRTFEFDLNVEQQEVQRVILDGEVAPYDLTLEVFLEWARR